MEADKVINSVFDYLETNMVPGMNNLQEIAFYCAKEAVLEEKDSLMEKIKNNPLLRAIVAVDSDGNVDVEKLARRLRKQIERKGSFSVDIPLYGPVRFVPEDVDNILRGLGYDESYQGIRRTY
jgi:hypothetical protein